MNLTGHAFVDARLGLGVATSKVGSPDRSTGQFRGRCRFPSSHWGPWLKHVRLQFMEHDHTKRLREAKRP